MAFYYIAMSVWMRLIVQPRLVAGPIDRMLAHMSVSSCHIRFGIKKTKSPITVTPRDNKARLGVTQQHSIGRLLWPQSSSFQANTFASVLSLLYHPDLCTILTAVNLKAHTFMFMIRKQTESSLHTIQFSHVEKENEMEPNIQIVYRHQAWEGRQTGEKTSIRCRYLTRECPALCCTLLCKPLTSHESEVLKEYIQLCTTFTSCFTVSSA